MATVTPNFNWPVPTSTDLVKDGATAIEALGDSIDASLVDLKGGTTGQVLSKTSNTDMDFTWVTSDDANAIQNSIVDAKGDLIAASAADTPARLAVGSDGETLVADSSTTTGLRYQGSMAAGKNSIINGNFDIWQRGTSFTTNSSATQIYTADRWVARANFPGGSAVQTLTQETTEVPAGSKYSLKSVIATGTPTSQQRMNIAYTMENQDALSYAGKVMTLSFQVKAIANANRIICAANYNTSGATIISAGSTQIITQTSTINSSTFTTISLTFTVPSAATLTSTGTLGVEFVYFVNGGSEAIGDGIYLSQVQVELGSVKTVFASKTGSIQGELDACQRYYYRQYVPAISNGFGIGMADTTTSAFIKTTYPVTMRTSPTALEQTGTAGDYGVRSAGAVITVLSAVPAFSNANPNEALTTFTVASGLTAGQAIVGRAIVANAYLGWSAEL